MKNLKEEVKLELQQEEISSLKGIHVQAKKWEKQLRIIKER
jgi:hypothetical protein